MQASRHMSLDEPWCQRVPRFAINDCEEGTNRRCRCRSACPKPESVAGPNGQLPIPPLTLTRRPVLLLSPSYCCKTDTSSQSACASIAFFSVLSSASNETAETVHLKAAITLYESSVNSD